jgi:predicted O-methyltransferase YrrM
MNQEKWSSVDRYIANQLIPEAEALNWILQANAAANLPLIDVTPAQGKLLQLLIRMLRAKTVLEIGTLGGYSTIWMARGLSPEGRLVTLEIEPLHAAVARANIKQAGLEQRVDLRLGNAIDLLEQLRQQQVPPFDFVFVDADKPSSPAYFQWALELTKPGSLIVVDNVVRDGEVANASSQDESVIGIRKLFEMIANEGRVTATAIQTVCSKGYDGFAIVMVN